MDVPGDGLCELGLASAGTRLLHQIVHVLGGMFVLTPHMVGHHLLSTPGARQSLHAALGPDPAVRQVISLSVRVSSRFLFEIGVPLDRYGGAVVPVAQRAGVSTAEIEPLLTSARQPTSAALQPTSETEVP
jgi:hypothetical protein